MSNYRFDNVRIDTSQFDKAVKRAIKRAGPKEVGPVLDVGASVVEREAKLNIKTHDLILTGNLRGSIQRALRVLDGQMVAYIGSAVEYARIHELGGIITPKRAKVLRFQVNGRWVTAKRVQIPPRPYLRPALWDHRQTILDVIGRALIKYLGGA